MSKKKSTTYPPCPYCARPEMFEPRADSSKGVSRLGELTHTAGKYWLRQEGRFPNVRSFPARLYAGEEVRYCIAGAEHFTEPYQGFDIEVIGLTFPFRPMQSAGPGFHQVISYKPGSRRTDEAREIEKVRSFNACRITHRETGVVADAHAWETHGLIVTVKHLPKNPTGEAMKAASTLFVFFSLEYRGAPKITRDKLMDALQEMRPEERTLSAVARKLGVTRQALQMWGRREGMAEWGEMRRAFEPHTPM